MTSPHPAAKARRPRAPRKPRFVRNIYPAGDETLGWIELRQRPEEDAREAIQVAGSHTPAQARRLASWLLRAADWLDAQASRQARKRK